MGLPGFALLSASSGDGLTGGSIACRHEPAHHAGTITVHDETFGSGVAFRVSVDTQSALPLSLDGLRCGDFQFDASVVCWSATPCRSDPASTGPTTSWRPHPWGTSWPSHR